MQEERRKQNEGTSTILHAFEDHAKDDAIRFEASDLKIDRLDEKLGVMLKKVDEMHAVFTQGMAIKSVFGSIGGLSKWVLIIAAALVVIKSFGATLVAWFVSNKP